MRHLLYILSVILIHQVSAQTNVTVDYENRTRPILKIQLPKDEKKKEELIRLYVENTPHSTPAFPVIGDYWEIGDSLYFQPKFELNQSIPFRVELQNSSFKLTIPPPPITDPVKISNVYPLCEAIPQNILTFYIEFSSTMKPNPLAYEYIEVVNGNGEVIPLVWREKSYWINENKTLVLMIHPGRVKNGIHATYDLEPIFIENNNIKLRIKHGLESTHNGALASPVEFEYKILAKDTISPKFIIESLVKPTINSFEPVQFAFTEQIDFGLLHKWFHISINNEIVKGNLSTLDGETWLFTPENKWKPALYDLKIMNKIGDVCHNQLDRLFEVESEADIHNTSYYECIQFKLE